MQDVAICAYNKSEKSIQRERIYRRFIYPPFMKLSENLINKVKPTYIKSSFQDLQTDLVTYLTARLDKFKPNAGKSYSYYTRTSFNYLIAENQKAYVKLKQDRQPIDVDERRNIVTEMHNDDMRETLKEFMDAYIEYCYDNINYIFSNPTDIHVADSILHIFEVRDNIENYNKKALYIFIRERTGLQTTNITKVIKVLKNLYELKFDEYSNSNFMKLPF
jgi:hypothetical protein|tara:strand:+ start:334 stop:990 length:657 start_codon:yes stop_codon:yes gene_type:complete